MGPASADKKAIIIMVPFKLLKQFHKIQIRLVSLIPLPNHTSLSIYGLFLSPFLVSPLWPTLLSYTP